MKYSQSQLKLSLQESAKYAHSLFQNTVMLYGRPLRVDYSPQGNPEPKTAATIGRLADVPAAAPPGSVAAAGGGFILKRKNRHVESSITQPMVELSEASRVH